MYFKKIIEYTETIVKKIAPTLNLIGIICIPVVIHFATQNYTEKVDEEKNIKSLLENLMIQGEQQREALHSYVALRFHLERHNGQQTNREIQKLLCQQRFISILAEQHPNIESPLDIDMARRLEIVDKLIAIKESPERVFFRTFDQKDTDQAIEGYKSFEKEYQKHWLKPWAQYNLGILCERKGELNDAIQCLEKSITSAKAFNFENKLLAKMLNRTARFYENQLHELNDKTKVGTIARIIELLKEAYELDNLFIYKLKLDIFISKYEALRKR